MLGTLMYRGTPVAKVAFDERGILMSFQVLEGVSDKLLPFCYGMEGTPRLNNKPDMIRTWLEGRFYRPEFEGLNEVEIDKQRVRYLRRGARSLVDGWYVQIRNAELPAGKEIAADIRKEYDIDGIRATDSTIRISFDILTDEDWIYAFNRLLGFQLAKATGTYSAEVKLVGDEESAAEVVVIPYEKGWNFYNPNLISYIAKGSKNCSRIGKYATFLEEWGIDGAFAEFYKMLLLDFVLVNPGRVSSNFGVYTIPEYKDCIFTQPFMPQGNVLYADDSDFKITNRHIPSGSFVKWLDTTLKSIPVEHYMDWIIRDPNGIEKIIIDVGDICIGKGCNVELANALVNKASYVIFRNLRMMARFFGDDEKFIAELQEFEDYYRDKVIPSILDDYESEFTDLFDAIKQHSLYAVANA